MCVSVCLSAYVDVFVLRSRACVRVLFSFLSCLTDKISFWYHFYRTSHRFHFPLLCDGFAHTILHASLSLPLSSSPVCLVACHDSAFVLLSVGFLPKLLLALRALLFLFEVRICTHNMNDNKDKSGIKSESTLKIEWIIAVHLYTRTLLLFSSLFFVRGRTTKTTRNCAERIEITHKAREGVRRAGLTEIKWWFQSINQRANVIAAH